MIRLVFLERELSAKSVISQAGYNFHENGVTTSRR